ncbi:MAG: VanZ family protein [Candidatus Cloacimonetes bacterium]|nr:VanZ family protein [Candidatus Cloacimonadota bacterium]
MNDSSTKFKIAFYFWLILMLIGSSIPVRFISPEKMISWDKLAHLLEYSILAVLYHLMQRQNGKSLLMRHYLLLALALPAIDELHQLLIPGRSCSYLDFTADFLGVSGIFLLLLILRKSRKIRI